MTKYINKPGLFKLSAEKRISTESSSIRPWAASVLNISEISSIGWGKMIFISTFLLYYTR